VLVSAGLACTLGLLHAGYAPPAAAAAGAPSTARTWVRGVCHQQQQQHLGGTAARGAVAPHTPPSRAVAPEAAHRSTSWNRAEGAACYHAHLLRISAAHTAAEVCSRYNSRRPFAAGIPGADHEVPRGLGPSRGVGVAAPQRMVQGRGVCSPCSSQRRCGTLGTLSSNVPGFRLCGGCCDMAARSGAAPLAGSVWRVPRARHSRAGRSVACTGRWASPGRGSWWCW
jgi:hypothetical protein